MKRLLLCAFALFTTNINADTMQLDEQNSLVFSHSCTEAQKQATRLLCIHLKDHSYDIPLIKSFLKDGADVNVRIFCSDRKFPDTLLFGPLGCFHDKYSITIKCDAVSVLRLLFEAGADPISEDCGYVFFGLLLQSLENYLYEHISSNEPKAAFDSFFLELRQLTVATHFRMIQDHNPAYTPELQARLAQYYPYFYSAALPDALDNLY